MPADVWLIAVLVIPVIVLMVLRINAAMVFLSLCLGEVLVTRVAQDTNSFLSFVSPRTDSISTTTLQLVMLFGPVVLTSIIMLLSVRGKLRVVFNVLPAAGVSFLGLLLAVPLFTPGLRYMIEGLPLWRELSKAQAFIVWLSALISLLFLWMHRRYAQKHESRRHH